LRGDEQAARWKEWLLKTRSFLKASNLKQEKDAAWIQEFELDWPRKKPFPKNNYASSDYLVDLDPPSSSANYSLDFSEMN